MPRHLILASSFAALLCCGTAFAQEAPPPMPPEKALKLSQIIAKIETRDQFRYIDAINWDDDGFYDVTYLTTDKAKVEIKIDAVTGQPR